eukprot:608939_1
MAATAVNSLLELTNQELISTSINLIENASTTALKNCFDNIFKEAVMKYVLKIVIPEEIHQLSTTSNRNWQRVSLIQKISTLHEQPSIPNNADTRNTLDSKSSTHYLLTSGFIRNELIGNQNTCTNMSHDIISTCQQFIGACPLNPLVVFNHESQSYHTVPSDSNPFTAISNTKRVQKHAFPEFVSHVSSNQTQMQLIKPNNVLLFDSQGENVSYCDTLPSCPRSSDVCVNIQTLRVPEQRSNQMHHMFMSPAPHILPLGMDYGAGQYLDAERLQLLQFGGVTTTSEFGGHSLHSSMVITPIHTTSLGVVMNDTIDRYKISTGSNNWTETGHLIHGRAYMSLCNVKRNRLAIIGGQQYKQCFGYSPSVAALDSVEIYDLTDHSAVNISINSMNYARVQCGSFYNDISNQLIVFGGSRGFKTHVYSQLVRSVDPSHHIPDDNASRSMEIYDFHKNKWFDVPYKSNNKYEEYPCIWTIGSQCVFVSQINNQTIENRAYIESEWIDLRICDKNGTNKAMFNEIDVDDHVVADVCANVRARVDNQIIFQTISEPSIPSSPLSMFVQSKPYAHK